MCCQIVDSPNIKGKENTWYFRIFSCSFLLEKDKATRDAWYYQCTHWNGLSFWGFLYFRSFPAPFISTPLKLNMEPLFMAMVSSKPQKLLFHIQNSHTIWSSIPKKSGCIPVPIPPVPTSNSATSSDGGLSSDPAVGRRAMDGSGGTKLGIPTGLYLYTGMTR